MIRPLTQSQRSLASIASTINAKSDLSVSDLEKIAVTGIASSSSDVEPGDLFCAFAGAKVHENSIFLYKSHQADYFVKHRITDYFAFGALAGLITGVSPFLFIPTFLALTRVPRYLGGIHYFTFHAELLPHTEQVVFHKANVFGSIERHFVNIHALEKVDADHVKSSILWDIFMFDKQMIWRCAESQEVFVFDRDGVWNKEALEHPLLN